MAMAHQHELGLDCVVIWCRPTVLSALYVLPQANASSLAFNASEPGFGPASVGPLLQGNFSGAYDAAASSPFVSLVNGSAANGQTLQQLIANVSSGAVSSFALIQNLSSIGELSTALGRRCRS